MKSFAGFVAAMVLCAIGSLGVTGCHSRAASSDSQKAESNAQREAIPSGEVWRATTRTHGANTSRPSWVTIKEEVRLSPEGRLVYSDTHVTDDLGSPEVRVVCEPALHRVVVERGGRHVEWTVPETGEPWMLAPVRGPSGEVIPTPLVAWTTWRATRNAEWVRLVTPLEQKSFIVPRDQYVIDRSVIVGDQSVDVDEQFVRAIEIGGALLARGAGDMHAAFRFRG